MATVPPHGLLRIGGTLYGGSDWSIGVRAANEDGSDPFVNSQQARNPQPILEQWADTVKGLNGGAVLTPALATCIGSQATITTIRCSAIGTDGREEAVAQITNVGKTGAGGYRNDAQTALCVSLLSARPGASYRGRMYLPALTPAVQTTGLLDPQDVASIASDAAGWIAAVANAMPDQASNVGVQGHGAFVLSTTRGVLSRIVSVRVGNRLDSQRRRAEGQQEAYSSSAVAQ